MYRMNATAAWPRHGGQARALLERHGLPPERPLVDFSVNINPLGPPAWIEARLAASLPQLTRYPNPDDLEARAALAASEGVTPEHALLTNGGVEAIFLAAALHAGQRAIIVQPTFLEYARACRHYGLTLSEIGLDAMTFTLDERVALEAMARCDVMFLCRPNNPTGTLIPRTLIERMLDVGLRHGSTLVVDEAFVDFVDEDERLTPLLADYPNLLLLRSLTKLYALPGLRLGYLLGSDERVCRAAERQLPWSVNALAAGLVAPLLADKDFLARTRVWLATERRRLERGMRDLGLCVIDSRANFLLLRESCPTEAAPGVADALFGHLLAHGILARHTHNFTGLDGAWLRLAVRDSEDNQRLLQALAAWRKA